MAAVHPRCVVIGLGNPGRGDDAAGREVARQLRGASPPGITIADANGEATEVIAALNGAAAAFLVDACASGAAPGTIWRFDMREESLPKADFSLSTHGFGLVEAVELARALKCLPPRCIVYAIEGDSFDAGAPVSPPVARAVVQVVERLLTEIGADKGAK